MADTIGPRTSESAAPASAPSGDWTAPTPRPSENHRASAGQSVAAPRPAQFGLRPLPRAPGRGSERCGTEEGSRLVVHLGRLCRSVAEGKSYVCPAIGQLRQPLRVYLCCYPEDWLVLERLRLVVFENFGGQ